MSCQSAKPNPKHIVFDLAVSAAIGERRLDRSPAFIKKQISRLCAKCAPFPLTNALLTAAAGEHIAGLEQQYVFLVISLSQMLVHPNDKLLLGEWEAKSDGMNGENVQKIISIGDR